jgi:hypothetical protein
VNKVALNEVTDKKHGKQDNGTSSRHEFPAITLFSVKGIQGHGKGNRILFS